MHGASLSSGDPPHSDDRRTEEERSGGCRAEEEHLDGCRVGLCMWRCETHPGSELSYLQILRDKATFTNTKIGSLKLHQGGYESSYENGSTSPDPPWLRQGASRSWSRARHALCIAHIGST